MPADLQRAAPETYRSIRAEGVASIRQWILDQFGAASRTSPEFQHLFQTACQCDYILASAKNESELNHTLATNDQLEILLRELGSYIYEKRTSDKMGALHMKALRTPGTNTDILPSWLVDQGTLHSRNEWKRSEAVKGLKTSPGGNGGKGAKGKGKKGKDKKGKPPKEGAVKAAAAPSG